MIQDFCKYNQQIWSVEDLCDSIHDKTRQQNSISTPPSFSNSMYSNHLHGHMPATFCLKFTEPLQMMAPVSFVSLCSLRSASASQTSLLLPWSDWRWRFFTCLCLCTKSWLSALLFGEPNSLRLFVTVSEWLFQSVSLMWIKVISRQTRTANNKSSLYLQDFLKSSMLYNQQQST